MNWLAVGLGGALGSLARHGVNLTFAHLTERSTPYATATVNIIGALAIGVLAGLDASGRMRLPGAWRTLVFVGVLGGFTTFSSFMLDTLTLGHSTEHGLAAANLLVQTAVGLLAVFGGYAAATVR